MLDRLHAVMHVPSDNKNIISTFHASFGDFLTTPGRVSDEMLINLPATHITLFSTCIQVMGSQLHFNISNCPTSYFPNTYYELKIPALPQLNLLLLQPCRVLKSENAHRVGGSG
jgi:hypothetical protein